MADSNSKPLEGVQVLDLAHQYAGSLAGTLLADLGANVVALEHPKGSSVRTMLPKKDGISLWWKVTGRGKRAGTLDFSTEKGRELLLRMVPDFDVVIENFRPGTMERWGLGPDDLQAAGANAVMLRISGYGQTGRYRSRPGFGSIAEAISGFAHLNGFPDGPPVFPSTTLADGITGTFGALGVAAALAGRNTRGGRGDGGSGVQVVDASLVESMFRLIPTQVIGYDQLGIVPMRPGNYIGSHGVLRNLYQTDDDNYFCMSAVGVQMTERVLNAIGEEELANEVEQQFQAADTPTISAFLERADEAVRQWALQYPYEKVQTVLHDADVVFELVYDIERIMASPYFAERGNIVEVPDDELGAVRMQGVTPKFPGQDQQISHAGKALGADTNEIFFEYLGLSDEDIKELRREGVL